MTIFITCVAINPLGDESPVENGARTVLNDLVACKENPPHLRFCKFKQLHSVFKIKQILEERVIEIGVISENTGRRLLNAVEKICLSRRKRC